MRNQNLALLALLSCFCQNSNVCNLLSNEKMALKSPKNDCALCKKKWSPTGGGVSHGWYSTVIKGRDRPTQTPNPCLCMPSCHHKKALFIVRVHASLLVLNRLGTENKAMFTVFCPTYHVIFEVVAHER